MGKFLLHCAMTAPADLTCGRSFILISPSVRSVWSSVTCS